MSKKNNSNHKHNMKGMELPINMIIVVAIALLVLMTVFVFFLQGTGAGLGSIEVANIKARACNALTSGWSCDPSKVSSVIINGYQTFGNGVKSTSTPGAQINLLQLCQVSGINDATACARSCGCPV